VSARYKVNNRGFLATMVGFQYNMMYVGMAPFNFTSVLSLWGGCMAFRRQVLDEIGGFKHKMILEDVNAALDAFEKGWRIEQSWVPVLTNSPATFREWVNQIIRWVSGGIQCFLSHPVTYIKNPLIIFFSIGYGSLGFLSLITFFLPVQFNLQSQLAFMGLYVVLSLPYAGINIRKFREWFRGLLIIPYVLIYMPILSFFALIGIILGVKKFAELRNGGRGW
jgi:cellulose synthase/poly-beta-1,6-N-acetylglucosamine synthase-like glycosyltransferase